MIDKTKYFDYPIPDLTNGIYIYYFCDGTKYRLGERVGEHDYIIGDKTFNNVGKYDYTVNSESFYIRKVSIFDAIVTNDGWIPAIAFDGKEFGNIVLRHSEFVVVEYPFDELAFFNPMTRKYFLSLKEAESTAEYLMELERKKKNEEEN